MSRPSTKPSGSHCCSQGQGLHTRTQMMASQCSNIRTQQLRYMHLFCIRTVIKGGKQMLACGVPKNTPCRCNRTLCPHATGDGSCARGHGCVCRRRRDCVNPMGQPACRGNAQCADMHACMKHVAEKMHSAIWRSRIRVVVCSSSQCRWYPLLHMC